MRFDLVVDFITYVFVPAFVIAESGLVWKPTCGSAGRPSSSWSVRFISQTVA